MGADLPSEPGLGASGLWQGVPTLRPGEEAAVDPKGPRHGLPSSPSPGSRAWERRPEDAHHDPAWSIREARAGTAPARPWEQGCSLT